MAFRQGRLIHQSDSNWIDYSHPSVFKSRLGNEHYFVVRNDQTFHIPLDGEILSHNTIDIPRPEEDFPLPQGKEHGHIPFLWKEKYLKEIDFENNEAKVLHPNNHLDYLNSSIKCTRSRLFYQILEISQISYIKVPKPTEAYDGKVHGLIKIVKPLREAWPSL
jgi:hypothetical protein